MNFANCKASGYRTKPWRRRSRSDLRWMVNYRLGGHNQMSQSTGASPYWKAHASSGEEAASGSATEPVLLTLKQRELLEQTWKIVEDDTDGFYSAGMVLFKNVFTICPDAQKMFKSFADVPLDDLPDVEEFCDHAVQVMEAMSLAVSSLDELNHLEMMMSDLGQVHCPQGLENFHFDAVGKALLMTLEEGLGKTFTPEVKAAYETFFKMISWYMKRGLESERRQPQPVAGEAVEAATRGGGGGGGESPSRAN